MPPSLPPLALLQLLPRSLLPSATSARSSLLALRALRLFSSTTWSMSSSSRISFPDLRPPSLSVPFRDGQQQDFSREAFTLQIPLLAVRVPARRLGEVKKQLASAVLSQPRVSSIVDDSAGRERCKLLLLDKAHRDELPSEVRDVLDSEQEEGLELREHTLTVPYEYWNANQILKAILPPELHDDLPSSFTIVGHIAHFNLRDEYLPYKHLIGRVVLDKNPSLRTVVNKLDSISASFRFFEMEVLARRLPSPSPSSDLPASGSSNEPEAEAESEFVVTTHENGCSFTFDFSKVYWNSRLQAEHTRLTDLFAPEDVLADGFAGVGPFALPAAKGRKCLGVFANDLNPASASSLVQNVKANKVEHNVRCYNLDGGEFFRKVVQEAYADPFVRSKAAGPAQGAGARKAAKLARREREREATSSRAAAAAVVDDKSLAAADPASALAPPAPTPSPLGRFIDHFVMNLPATAIDLLGCFRGLYVPLLGRTEGERALFYERWEAYSAARAGAAAAASAVVSGTVPTKRRRPMVHCYCFTKEGPEGYEAAICERASRSLGYTVTKDSVDDFSLSLVRSVAPKKDMYRLSFRLPEEVLFASSSSSESESEGLSKAYENSESASQSEVQARGS